MKEFETVAELEASKQTVSDLMLYCRENNLYYIVQDAGYTPVGDDVTFINGRVGKAVFIADAKYIRTTSGNVQDELDSIVAGGLPSQSGNQFKFLSTDGTNAQWSNGQIEVETFAGLEALEPEAEGLVFICQERANAKYILQGVSYTALAGDVTFANGRVGELQIGGTVLTGWFDNITDAVARGRDILVTDDYTVSGVLSVNCTNEAFTIDLAGHTLTSNNAGIFSAFGGLLYEQNASGHTANTITIGISNDLVDYLTDNIDNRPVIKIVSDDAIDVNENANERRGEFARVASVASGVITLETDLYFTYTTAPRVAALVSEKFTIKNGTLDVSDLGTVRGSHVFCTKLYQPVLEDIEVLKGNDAGIVLRSCYESKVIRPSIHNLTDNAGGGFFGYGIDDSSSHATLVTDGDFSNTRHAYTTNTGESVAGGDMAAFGPTMYSKVKDCACTGNSDDAFDTHPNAYFITFENVKGYRNSKGLVKDRGKFTTVSCETYGDGFGIRTATRSDNMTIKSIVSEGTLYPLFLTTDVESNVHVVGGNCNVTSGNECFRLTNTNLRGSVDVSYSGTTNNTNVFRMTNSTVNMKSVDVDLSGTSVATMNVFGLIDATNKVDIKSLNLSSDTVNTTVILAYDFSGGSTNEVNIQDTKSVTSYATTNDMLSSIPIETGLRAENHERNLAQYELAEPSYVALAGDITAANGRVWRLIFNGELNVLWFGADPLTDSTVAIQSAINRASMSASALVGDDNRVIFSPIRVMIPSGAYLVSSTITMNTSFVELVGEGLGASVLYRTNGTYGNTISISPSDPNTARLIGTGIRNIKLDARTDMTTGSHLRLESVTQYGFNNLFFENGFINLEFGGLQNVTFESIFIESGRYYPTLRTGSRFLRVFENASFKNTEVLFNTFNFTFTINSTIEAGIEIDSGDGIWFSDGHVLGADIELLLESTGTTSCIAMLFNDVWFDGFCSRNVVIRGNTTGTYKNIEFNNCRFSGATDNLMVIESGCTVGDVVLTAPKWKNCNGSGIDAIGGAELIISDFDCEDIARAATANQYVVRVPTGSSIDTLQVLGGRISATTIDYGIRNLEPSCKALIQNIEFRGVQIEEVDILSSGFDGRVSNCITDRANYSDVASSSSVDLPVIADVVTITGATDTIDTLRNGWDGRKITLRGGTAAHTLSHGTGNMLFNGNPTGITLNANRGRTLVFSSAGNVWYEV